MFERPARRQRRAAIEDANVIETEEAAFKNVGALGIFAIDPPGEVHEQLVEDALEKVVIGLALLTLIDFEDAPGGPSMHGRIDISVRRFIGGELTVGVHVPFAQEEGKLRVGEVRIGGRHGDSVKGQIPGGVPRILPLIGHGNDIFVEEMTPARVAAFPALGRRLGHVGIAGEPFFDHVVIELLAPKQASESLALDVAWFLGEAFSEGVVEIHALFNAAV